MARGRVCTEDATRTTGTSWQRAAWRRVGAMRGGRTRYCLLLLIRELRKSQISNRPIIRWLDGQMTRSSDLPWGAQNLRVDIAKTEVLVSRLSLG
jgi:hypothetical protein